MAITVTAPGMETCIVTRDFARMLAFFYRDHLGFELRNVLDLWETAQVRIHVLAVTDTASLKLAELATPPAESNPGGGNFGASGLRYTTFWVSSIDAALDGIDATGARVIGDFPGVAFGANRAAMIQDPDGNIFELAEPLA